MARTKQTARRTYKPFITWTRFYLPQGQEWPTWAVDHDDVHVGPLTDVEGCRKLSLGRMVDNPEQAAYIIRQCFGLAPETSDIVSYTDYLRRMGHAG